MEVVLVYFINKVIIIIAGLTKKHFLIFKLHHKNIYLVIVLFFSACAWSRGLPRLPRFLQTILLLVFVLLSLFLFIYFFEYASTHWECFKENLRNFRFMYSLTISLWIISSINLIQTMRSMQTVTKTSRRPWLDSFVCQLTTYRFHSLPAV